jgi:hypothetical protein
LNSSVKAESESRIRLYFVRYLFLIFSKLYLSKVRISMQ